MTVGVIGGSGFHQWDAFSPGESIRVSTPYAPDPVSILSGTLGEEAVMFIPRHGAGHSVPPHRINYRANVWALRQIGVDVVVSIATVGGISRDAAPGTLLIPDQILDYTYGRAHTFFDGDDGVVKHADMTEPYCEALRRRLVETAGRLDIAVVDGGVYAATQGPRFETPAEIRRLERDGADVVGMTGMPEAALAKEIQLPYAAIALVANAAAGKAGGEISMDAIMEILASAKSRVERLLTGAIPGIRNRTFSVSPPMQP